MVERSAAEWALDLMPERMFLAVALDEETRHAVAARLRAALDGRHLPGRSVPVPNWHITLRFLGATGEVERDRVLAELDEHLAVSRFRLRFGGLGAFPREAKASVLWVGCEGDIAALGEVAVACEDAARAAGFEPEGRPFHPHLTLSRIRPPRDVRETIDLVPVLRVGFEVSEVTLYRSILGRGPASYEVVDTVEL
jgi:2'-5' RNA ligase